jgi:hypothetical protein
VSRPGRFISAFDTDGLVDNKAISGVLEKRKNIFYLPGKEPLLAGGSAFSIIRATAVSRLLLHICIAHEQIQENRFSVLLKHNTCSSLSKKKVEKTLIIRSFVTTIPCQILQGRCYIYRIKQ